MIIKKLLTFLQLFVLSINIALATQGSNLAAIEILPYDETRSNFQHSPEQHYRRYLKSRGETNEYNLGPTFCYLSKDFTDKIIDSTYMDALADYSQKFNQENQQGIRNVLFVRMQVLAAENQDSPPVPYEYLSGIFVTGGGSSGYKCGTVRGLTGVSRDLPALLKNAMERNALYRLLKDQNIVDALKTYSSVKRELLDTIHQKALAKEKAFIEEVISAKAQPEVLLEKKAEAGGNISEEEVVAEILSGDIYSTPVFELGNEKLVPVSSSFPEDLDAAKKDDSEATKKNKADLDALKKSIEKRIFEKAEIKAALADKTHRPTAERKEPENEAADVVAPMEKLEDDIPADKVPGTAVAGKEPENPPEMVVHIEKPEGSTKVGKGKKAKQPPKSEAEQKTQQLPKSEIEKNEETLRSSQETLDRSILTPKLYGQSCYIGDNACLGKKLGYCFNQTEQTFLSWLERAGSGQGRGSEELQQNLISIGEQELDSSGSIIYNIEGVQIHLYSYLDICRYCRGTMSYMLHNGNMAASLRDFFTEGLKIRFNENLRNVHIFAFSTKSTDI